MTVRWKPLLILSGLFAVIALAGFAAIAYTLVPRGAKDILPSARAARTAGQYEKAKIYYQQALQIEGKNAAIHEELAAMYGEWADHAPAEKQAEYRAAQLAALAEATKHGKNRAEPRRKLLAAAMARDEVPESLHWAKDLLTLEPANADAHYVVASESLEARVPPLPEVRRHLAALEEAKAPEVRIAWVKARLAQAAGDPSACEAALARSRTLKVDAAASPVDRSALVRLRALDVERSTDAADLPARVKALQSEARALVAGPSVAPNRVMRLSLLLERVQKSLILVASRGESASQAKVNTLVDSIEEDVEAIFKRATAAATKTDLHIDLTYADHLRFRGKRDRCLEVVDQALKSPKAKLQRSAEAVMGLHAVAVESALSDVKDAKRADKAVPHIKELIASNLPRFEGLGHLFQGAIDLEDSGVAGVSQDGVTDAPAPAAQPKLRASALGHLKAAAALLPDVVEAQARYGVALILSQDMALGRQYLQNAMRLGNAEPQYQIWAAWSMLQAGYPEEAEPVVNHLLTELEQGRLTHELQGTLHLLSGEIHQAGRSPEDMKKALGEFEKSYEGKEAPPSIQLRMAQIDIQLGRPDQALRRVERLRAQGQGGPAAEQLAVLILGEQEKDKDARDTLSKARARYPESEELVGLEASLLVKDKKPQEADKVLADYLTRNPDRIGVVLNRAQVLSELLSDVKEARKLLLNVADRSENSAPLVQLALLDMGQKDYDAVAASIAKVRSRWKDAAAADLLDAQLALEQGRLAAAAGHFDAALKKDPGNKMVQYWKAQVDSRVGSSNEAVKAFEALAKDGSSKQLESGLSLAAASRSALANLALQNGDVEGAIRRFENLRTGGTLGGLSREDRWQLIAAYAAKGQWPAARKEMAALVNDPKKPPTNDERVRAANYYRLNGEEPAAVAQLEYVLQVNPAQPGAVVTRAYMLAEKKKTADALALIRKAIDAPGKDKSPAVFHLLLAALENVSPPQANSALRAMSALDKGLAAEPESTELIQAKYALLQATEGPAAALAFVEGRAKDDTKGTMRRMLAEVYREQKDYDKAETTLRDLVAKDPKDAGLAAALVRVTALQSVRAGERDDRDRERAVNDKCGGLIREFRTKFPAELVFLQEDFDLAFRRGDVTRAAAVTQEIDALAKNSPVGPLLRARLYAAQGRTREVVGAYEEALLRNPAQSDVRLLLGQAHLRLGQNDEAVRQARLVLESDRDRADAVLLEARALSRPSDTAEQTATRREQAVGALNGLLKSQPKLTAAYHQIAEIRLLQDQREEAVKTLRAGLDAVPEDAIGLTQLIELYSSPAEPGAAPDPSRLKAAADLAAAAAGRDKTGGMALAAAVGFHKAGQLPAALAWAEKAAAKLDIPVLHLNYGDILLSVAERAKGDEAKDYFRRAVGEYDLVLKAQANSVEAVNNKAWILHTAMGESRKALDIAQGLLKRVDPSTLPGEFFDTLGAIEEATGQAGEAEDAYAKGLRKSPDHPVLNYHMGKLLVADPRKASKARAYIEKAFAARSRLSPSMAAEVATLMKQVQARYPAAN